MRTKTILNVFGLLALASCILIISTPALAARSQREGTQAVQGAIKDRLEKHGLMQGNDIQVALQDSVISLKGTVNTIFQRQKVEDYARQVAKGYRVQDDLAVRAVGLSDDLLTQRVVKQVQDNIFYSVFDWVTISVKDGVASLRGWVYEPWHKRQFEHQVQRVEGIIGIDDQIQVLPGSIFDDDIRSQAIRVIYNNPSFWPYSDAPGPPIHIIVNNGQVTLKGEVATEHQKNWAQTLINFNTSALQVNNDLHVENRYRN